MKPPKKTIFKKRSVSRKATRVAATDDEQSSATSDAERSTYDDSLPRAVDEVRELQRMRQRPRGIVPSMQSKTSSSDASSKTTTAGAKLKTGGLVSSRELKGITVEMQSSGEEVDIGTEFSTEMNVADEEAEMRKFVEEQLRLRKGDDNDAPTTTIDRDGDANQASASAEPRRPEDALFLVAKRYDHLRSKRSEEMLSNQMLTGIPEVDLGVECKIRNVEATEHAKKRLIEKLQEADDEPSDLVAGNVAVNYVQHARYDMRQPTQNQPQDIRIELHGGKVAKIGGEATDDDVYAK